MFKPIRENDLGDRMYTGQSYIYDYLEDNWSPDNGWKDSEYYIDYIKRYGTYQFKVNGEDGSNIENEANAKAGELMRICFSIPRNLIK